MTKEFFYCNNHMSMTLEDAIRHCTSLEEFEKMFSEDFLNDDCRVGNYIEDLLWKYNRKKSSVSVEAGFHPSYVGNVVNRIKNNPSRDALIRICFAIGTTFDEAQYLLKYAGHAPLYVRNKRDVIIWFGFMKGQSLDDVEKALIDRGLMTLFGDK